MRKAVIVDFDGTLVDVNSFEKFYKRLFLYWLAEARILPALHLAGLAWIRKMRLISHAELKRRLLLYMKDKDAAEFLERFAAYLRSHVNAKVVELIRDYRKKGYAVLLCTAAPRLYMDGFASRFGFGFEEMACTEMPTKDRPWQENSGPRKLEAAQRLLRKRREELAVLITDSLDDMPLLCIEKEKNYLTTRSVRITARLETAGIDYEIV